MIGREPAPPLVSVYVANHNYGRFIEQAIESVLRQTMQDFELIIIDDGSTDDSRQIIERYADRPRVVTILQHNQGLNVTNNIAMRAASGRYIMRLDADDYLDEHALQVLSGALERNADVGLVFPDYYLVDEDGNVKDMVRRHDFGEVTLLDQPAHGACTMIRRACLQELGGYDEAFRMQDGYDLWIRFIERFGVRNVNLPLFYYRQHPRSLTRGEDKILATRAEIIRKRVGAQDRKTTAAAFIPVRGRAADPQSAALRVLGGKPLIDWTVEAALEAERVNDVVVTSPDDEVLAHVVRRFGDAVITIRRDRKLALLNTYLEDTVLHTLEAFRTMRPDPDVIALLYVESPFRTSHHIDSAIDVMDLFETDRVLAVRPETEVFYVHNGSGLEPVRQGRALRLEAEELYRAAGDMEIVRRTFFDANRTLSGGRTGHIVLDRKASISLLSEWDWQIAELLLAAEAARQPQRAQR